MMNSDGGNVIPAKRTVISETIKCIGAFLLLVSVTKLFETVTLVEIMSWGNLRYGDSKLWEVYSMLNPYIGAFALAFVFATVCLAFKASGKSIGDSLGFGKIKVSHGISSVVMGFSLQATLSAVLTLLYAFVPALSKYSVSDRITENFASSDKISEIIFIVIITPIVEETVFRGVIFKKLSGVMPPVAAAIIASVMFGAAHGNTEQFIYSTLIALVLSFVMYKTNSIIAPMILHAAFNGGSYILALIPVKTIHCILIIPAFLALFIITLVIGFFSKKGRASNETL